MPNHFSTPTPALLPVFTHSAQLTAAAPSRQRETVAKLRPLRLGFSCDGSAGFFQRGDALFNGKNFYIIFGIYAKQVIN